MNTRIVLPLSIFTFVLTILFIATSDISFVSYMNIFVRRMNWPHSLQTAKESKLGNVAGKFFNASTEDGIKLKSSPPPSNQAECEFVLGILTIPSHKELRNISRRTWIKDLPKNVCYIFLYDKRDYIATDERFDGMSLNVKYEGKGVRFGEKLIKYYKYIHDNPKYNNLKYVVKMDDDVVLCPNRLFPFLENQNINSKTYAGWFHNLHLKKVGYHHRSDEMFILIGQLLMTRIVSKRYCHHQNQRTCDHLGHLFDTNYGGTSLGLWLSKMNDVNELQMNDVFQDLRNSNKSLNARTTLLFHPTKTVQKVTEKYLNCQLL